MKKTKQCPKCGIKKPLNAFSKDVAQRDGLQVFCKFCRRVVTKAWRENNSDQIKRYDGQYRETHRERRREYDRQWRQKNRDYWRRYQREQLRTNLNYRLRNYIGAAIRRAIKKNRKSTFRIPGYTVDDLQQHLESLFQPGMSWENYGTEWHIDHVIPKSWFDLEAESGLNEYELKVCWSLENLQPMWMSENIDKMNRHISHVNFGQSQLSYEQFRILITHHKQDQIAFTRNEILAFVMS